MYVFYKCARGTCCGYALSPTATDHLMKPPSYRAIVKHRATKPAAALLFLNLSLLFVTHQLASDRLSSSIRQKRLILPLAPAAQFSAAYENFTELCRSRSHPLSSKALGKGLAISCVSALYPCLLRSLHWLHLLACVHPSHTWMCGRVARRMLAATDLQTRSQVPRSGRQTTAQSPAARRSALGK